MKQNTILPSVPLGALGLTLLLFVSSGCDVESTGEGTGGVDDGLGGAGSGECPSGTVVVMSDYVSTQVALSGLDGSTRSASFLSTASAKTDGLAFALSGDVGLPSTAPPSGKVVLLDRFGTNVITWADPKSAEVLAQLPVGTGFESNPHDYLEVSERLALVSRWGQNTAPGSEDHDDGGDLLLIDIEEYEIVGNLVLPTEDDLPARPSGLALIGDEVLVSLDRIALDFSETGEAMLVGVDAAGEEVLWEKTLDGRKACGRATLSPDGSKFAVACTGALGATGETESLSQSALMIFDATARPLRALETFEAEDLLGVPLQGSVAFVSDDLVLLKTQTPWGGEGNNQLFSLDLKTGDTQELLEASEDDDGNGKGLVYGALVCAPGCSDYCLMSDSDEGVVQRIVIDSDGSLSMGTPVVVEDQVGLPPIGLTLR